MKIHRALLVPVLLAFIFILTSTDGNSQIKGRKLGCRDSFNYALLYYNKGQFEKINSVTNNGNVTKQIKIKGYVWKAPLGAAPANASVQFLKQQIQ